jgi:hypothetical protein
LHAVGAGSGSTEQAGLLERVVELVAVFADAAAALTVEAVTEAVVLAAAAKRRRAADRRVSALDVLGLASAVSETLEDQIFGQNAILAVPACGALSDASAAIWESTRR